MATGVGIDIGAEFIKVVQASVSSSGVQITGAFKIPRKADVGGLDVPEEETTGLIIPEQLGEELKRAGLRRSGTVGVSGREVTLKYLALPPMPAEKIRIAVAMEVGGKMGKGPSEGPPVTYDYRLLNIPSGLRGDLVLMAGVCKNEYLFGVHAALKNAKIVATNITPSCFGLVNTYLRTQETKPEETVVLVEIGHELLEIAILEDKHLYFARSAPGGGRKFTAALDKVLKVGTQKATEYKHERAKLYPEGAQIPSKQELMFQSALKEGAENIAGAIRSSVMFCRTQAKLPKLDYQKIIISGGGARLNGLREYLEKKLARPVQILDLNKHVDMRRIDAASAKCFDAEIPDMATALGLAIVDADPGCFHFSLMPEKIIKRQNFLRKTVYGIAAGVVMAVGIIPPLQNSAAAVSAAEDRVQIYDKYIQDAQAKKAEFKKKVADNQRLAAKCDYYARQTRMSRIYVQLYNKLRAEAPPDVMFTYLGPATENAPGGATPAGIGNWTGYDSPETKFVVRGRFEAETYPGVKFNEAWENMRKKLLEIPGLRGASLEPIADEVDPNNGTPQATVSTSKPFELKIYLQDEKEPLKLADEAQLLKASQKNAPKAPNAKK